MKKMWKRWMGMLLAVVLAGSVLFAGGTSARAAETTVLTGTIKVTYAQTMARKVTSYVNAFRTGDDTWYWNESNTKKVQVSGLSKLTYDYALEAVAMQRAAEVALSFSHTRPDGTSCFTAFSENEYIYVSAGENIAAGQTSAKAVFTAWLEENDDYSGQGHRRNMLGSYYNRIGMACVQVDGHYYWVMELARAVDDTGLAKTEAIDSACSVPVTILASDITSLTLTDTGTVKVTSKKTLKAPKAYVRLTNTVYGAKSITISRSCCKWKSANTSVVTVSKKGKATAVGKGTAKITVTVLSKYKQTIKVQVK